MLCIVGSTLDFSAVFGESEVESGNLLQVSDRQHIRFLPHYPLVEFVFPLDIYALP
jgi:hypothetical protein